MSGIASRQMLEKGLKMRLEKRASASRQSVLRALRQLGALDFSKDERGAMTIYLIVTLLLLVGFVGLVLDSSRAYVAHTNMQDFVDDVAVAAVHELDGQPDSITRADAVIKSTLSNADAAINIVNDNFEVHSWVYLDKDTGGSGQNLKFSDLQANALDPATEAEKATHVVIVAKPEHVEWGWLNAVNAATPKSDYKGGAFEVRTWSSAGLSERNTCLEPLFVMCVPPGVDFETLSPGTQLKMIENHDSIWSEGEYGIVQGISDDEFDTCAAYSGYDNLECLLAIDSHATECSTDSTVDFTADPLTTKSVSIGGTTIDVPVDQINVSAAVNTRFGIFHSSDEEAWDGSENISVDTNHHTSRDYQCDGTVTDESVDFFGLPIDPCFDDGTCTVVSGPLAAADLEFYWQAAHGEALPAIGSNGQPIESRYDAYLEEIALGYIDPQGDGLVGPRSQCHAVNSADETVAGRRTYEIAAIDCSQLGEGVTHTDIEAEFFFDVFVDRPVEFGDSFVADFDGPATWTDGSGVQETITMAAGHVVDADAETNFDANVTGTTDFYDAYQRQGMEITAFANNTGRSNGQNAAMLFDSQNYSGNDGDLQSPDKGNILIISEDGDANDPDDHAKGGMIIFQWDVDTQIDGIRFF
ncbi:MAG: pilus assembly protein TadG-related protein, partial [Pseudomonadota bacterium]